MANDELENKNRKSKKKKHKINKIHFKYQKKLFYLNFVLNVINVQTNKNYNIFCTKNFSNLPRPYRCLPRVNQMVWPLPNRSKTNHLNSELLCDPDAKRLHLAH